MGSCSERVKQQMLYGMPIEGKCNGETPIYRSQKSPNQLITHPNGLTTLQAVFQNSLKKVPNQPFLGSRRPEANNKYCFKTYAQANEIIINLGSAIKNMELAAKATFGSHSLELISVFCKNREEWMLLDITAVHYGFQLVPLYDTLRLDDIEHILKETEITTIFASHQSLSQLAKLGNAGQLKNIVCLDAIDELQKEKLKNFNLLEFNQLIQAGEEKRLPFADVKGESPFTFCYTSGTTGLPKGVVQTHLPILAFMPYVESLKSLNFNGAVHLSYLPLPHIFERTIIWAAIYFCGTLCFYGGDVQKITEDLKEVRPTFFISVPRLFNRIYSKMQNEIQKLTGIKKMLVNQAIAAKISNLERFGSYRHFLYDKLVFKKMSEAFGGRIQMMVSASAPIGLFLEQYFLLAPEIVKFLQIAISGPIIESYGLSETGSLTATEPFDNCFGHVGGPMPSIAFIHALLCFLKGQEIKLVDVEEMNYLSSHQNSEGIEIPQGEICSRSPCNFLGYYKNSKLTNEVIDSEGFFHTGDIAQILPNGVIQIIDRKKNIFKLQQGEYVAVEKVENIYTSVPGILQAFVYGDSLKAYLVAIIVPEQDYIQQLALQNNISGSFQELIQNKKIIELVLQKLVQEGKKANLYGYEQPKVIALESTLFDQNNLLSTTFKLIRAKAKQFYSKKIDELYSEQINFA